MTEMDLKAHVLDSLEFEPSIDAADIGGVVQDGVVTLTVHVRSFPERRAIRKAAWAATGVTRVEHDGLRVV